MKNGRYKNKVLVFKVDEIDLEQGVRSIVLEYDGNARGAASLSNAGLPHFSRLRTDSK